MDKSSHSRGRWLCQVCKKEKDLSGPHLNGKTSVRSDCWPCATKRQFDLVFDDNHGNSKETVKPNPNKTADEVSPLGEKKENEKKTSSLFSGFSLSNKSSETTVVTPDVTVAPVAPATAAKESEKNASGLFKGFQFSNNASENDNSGFQRILKPEKAASQVDTPHPSISKPENTADSEHSQWLCAHCRKAKDLSGPHLAGKHSVRSDCWPCATKREFIRTYLTPNTSLPASGPEKVEQLKPTAVDSTKVNRDLPTGGIHAVNASQSDVKLESREDKESLSPRVSTFIDSLKTPDIPENFNPFESAKSGSVFSTKGSQKKDQKTVPTASLESKVPSPGIDSSQASLLNKQPSSIPSPFAPTPIKEESSKAEVKSSEPTVSQPRSQLCTLEEAQPKPASTIVSPSHRSDKDTKELFSQMEKLAKRISASEERNKQLLKKVVQCQEQFQDKLQEFKRDIEERLDAQQNDVGDALSHITQGVRRLSNIYEEQFHDFAAMIIRKMD